MKLAFPRRTVEQLGLTSTEPFQSLLHGRAEFTGVCHEEPLQCSRCMTLLARQIAREMGHEVVFALDRPVELYAQDIAGSPDQARELRRLTVLACFLQQPWFDGFVQGTTIEELTVVEELGVAA